MDQNALPRTPGVLVVSRAKLSADDKRLEDVKILLNAEGTLGRVIQAPDGTLLVTSTIPAGYGINSADWPQPQALDSNMGKVLRINTDGTIPKDNPFVGRAGAHPEIFALGFRDMQGVAINPRTGKLWMSEHGVRGGDEINAVEKGKNYGFPLIGYGREYTESRSTTTKLRSPAWSSPRIFGRPTSRLRELPSITAGSFQHGRAICSSQNWLARRSRDWFWRASALSPKSAC
jgi:glucose/arabinose dehydrogenase